MSRSLNKVTLIGNVGGDPEIRTTASGTKLANLSLATGRTYKDSHGQQQERTEWHRITLWGRMADIVEQYVSKGDRLYIEGRLEYSQSEDGQGGTRYWTNIIAQEMIMLGSRGGRGQGGSSTRQQPQQAQPSAGIGAGLDSEDEDLPF